MPREQKMVTRKFRRRRYRRRGGKMTYNRVKAIARSEVKREERKTEELKAYALTDAGSSISATGTIFALSGTITQGVADYQRVGTQINLKNILIRFDITHSDSTQVVRVILFRWMAEGVPTSGSAIIEDTTVVPWLSPLSSQYAKFIQVIYDKSYSMSTNTDANVVGKIYKNLRGTASWTDGSASRIKGQLYLFVISDSAAVSHPTFKYSSKLRYTDA